MISFEIPPFIENQMQLILSLIHIYGRFPPPVHVGIELL